MEDWASGNVEHMGSHEEVAGITTYDTENSKKRKGKREMRFPR